MQSPITKEQFPCDSLEQAITDIIESIAIEDAALSSLLNSGGKILQEAKAAADNVSEFISVNQTVNNIIKNVIRLQILMQFKLETAKEMIHEIEMFDEEDELEE